MKRFISAMLITILLFSACIPVSADIIDRQDQYNAALLSLSRYLGRNDPENPTDLAALQQEFMDIGVYQQASGFYVYTSVLNMLEQPSYDRNMLQVFISMLSVNQDLIDLLNDETFEYYGIIRGIDELTLYVQGRQAEADGNTQEAISYYFQCLNFFDSTLRMIDLSSQSIKTQQLKYSNAILLFEAGNYSTAAELFRTLGAYEDAEQWAKYAAAMQQFADKNYEAAYQAFTALGEFQDAKTYAADAKEKWEASKVTSTPKVTKAPKPTKDPCAKGHDWKEATCTAPKTCSRCGKTSGKKLGHDWTKATCTTAKTCSRCGETSGKKLGHDWIAATCTNPKTCSRCGKTSGKKLGHDWKAATKDKPKTCSRCGKTEGKPLQAITQYRYRDLHEEYSEWSSWSEWAYNKGITSSSLMQVQHRAYIGGFLYYCANCGRQQYNSDNCAHCDLPMNELYNTKYITCSSESDAWAKIKKECFSKEGYRCFYYNALDYRVEEEVYENRYRTRTVKKSEWGSWSSWSTTKPASKTNRQIETRTVYK